MVNITKRIQIAREKRRRGEELTPEEVEIVSKQEQRDRALNAARSEVRKKRQRGEVLNEKEAAIIAMLDKASKKEHARLKNVRDKRKRGDALSVDEQVIIDRLDKISKKDTANQIELRRKRDSGELMTRDDIDALAALKEKIRRANAKQFPKRRMIEKEIRRTAWIDRMSQKGTVDEIWSPETIAETAAKCLQMRITNKETGKTYSVEEVLTSFGGYFGTTKQTLRREALAWLTPRGGPRISADGIKHKKTRPVLVHGDGSFIKPKTEAVNAFKFEFVILATSTLRANVCAIEDFLQERFQYLKLGVRLWRHVAKGEKYVDHEELCHVFFTYSFDLPKLIESGTVIVQK